MIVGAPSVACQTDKENNKICPGQQKYMTSPFIGENLKKLRQQYFFC